MKKYKKEYFGDLRFEFEYADQYKTGNYKSVKSISKVKHKNEDYYWEIIGKKSIKK